MKRVSFMRAGGVGLYFLCLVALARAAVIYEKTSPYNTIFVSEDQQGVRTLSFERNGARQSVVKVGDPDYIELPYVQAMLASLALIEQPTRMLVVGLGGGSIPTFLRRHYPQAVIDVVDIDPDVVEVAKTFFGFREDGKMRAHVRDGRKFVEECDQPYDLIFLDAFSADSIPYHLATREFLQAVRRALAPRGLAVANVWGRGSNPLYDSMVRTYQEVFDQLDLLDVPGAGNIILFAWPHREQLKRDDLARRAQALAKRYGLSFDLGQMIRYGFRATGVRRQGGRVLRDKPEEMPRLDPAPESAVREVAPGR